MNLVYGAVALLASLLISNKIASYKLSKLSLFAYAFALEFVVILVLGLVFYFFGWGFFSGPLSNKEIALKVVGFAAFLALLVGMRAVNQNARQNL